MYLSAMGLHASVLKKALSGTRRVVHLQSDPKCRLQSALQRLAANTLPCQLMSGYQYQQKTTQTCRDYGPRGIGNRTERKAAFMWTRWLLRTDMTAGGPGRIEWV